ncbi:hypothetical protein CcNV_078 [Crangon crangon nudivirus]|uniref:Uncharacterized protein n=1 Tax=Crangon crangon nudivirus TaxID=2880838 RepID=A0AAE8Y138_9VIRU|nr:hypothetical protein QKT25_gp079 [Crangon crangon nudivirus]UBZ25563.1 hypothetical protein CcNV_078 [Crangon crangon nudivirus]
MNQQLVNRYTTILDVVKTSLANTEYNIRIYTNTLISLTNNVQMVSWTATYKLYLLRQEVNNNHQDYADLIKIQKDRLSTDTVRLSKLSRRSTDIRHPLPLISWEKRIARWLNVNIELNNGILGPRNYMDEMKNIQDRIDEAIIPGVEGIPLQLGTPIESIHNAKRHPTITLNLYKEVRTSGDYKLLPSLLMDLLEKIREATDKTSIEFDLDIAPKITNDAFIRHIAQLIPDVGFYHKLVVLQNHITRHGLSIPKFAYVRYVSDLRSRTKQNILLLQTLIEFTTNDNDKQLFLIRISILQDFLVYLSHQTENTLNYLPSVVAMYNVEITSPKFKLIQNQFTDEAALACDTLNNLQMIDLITSYLLLNLIYQVQHAHPNKGLSPILNLDVSDYRSVYNPKPQQSTTSYPTNRTDLEAGFETLERTLSGVARVREAAPTLIPSTIPKGPPLPQISQISRSNIGSKRKVTFKSPFVVTEE